MPEEVNIDDLIDLPSDDERVRKLQVGPAVGGFQVFYIYRVRVRGDISR